jgi:putative ABC transport system permease protein
LAVTYPHFADASADAHENYFLHVIGRRKSGVSIETARGELSAIAGRLQVAHPEWNAGKGVSVVSLQDYLVGPTRSTILGLCAAVALLFVVLLGHLTSLVVIRTEARRPEIAARLALGATPTRILWLVLTEAMLVFGIGAAIAFALCHELSPWLARYMASSGGAGTIEVSVDVSTFLFCAVIAAGCAFISAAIPALAVTRIDPQIVLKQAGGPSQTGGRGNRTLGGFVSLQVALACLLLVAGTLTLSAFRALVGTQPGFEPEGVATARIELGHDRYSEQPRVLDFFDRALAHLRAYPGVEAAAGVSNLPLLGAPANAFLIEGRPLPPSLSDARFALGFHTVTPGYFRTMWMPLIRGRDFTEADRADTTPVVIISRSAAERDFPGEDAIGHRIDWGFNDGPWRHTWREIVGVVGDVRTNGLESPITPDGYVPLTQNPDAKDLTLVARSAHAKDLVRQIPSLVQSIDALQDVSQPALLSDVLAESMSSRRFGTTLLVAFALSALFLACLGVFALVSHRMRQRSRELAIRMALGASPGALLRTVLRTMGSLIAIGVFAGMLAALALERVLASQIPGVSSEWRVYVVIPPIVTIAGLLACVIPAARAVGTAPSAILRDG